MNYFRENTCSADRRGYLSFILLKRTRIFIGCGLRVMVLLFISYSSLSQEQPPPVAVPTPENARLIDKLLQITHFEDYFRAYCIKRISETAEEKKWSPERIAKITNSIDLKCFTFTVHNALSTYNTKQLESFIEKYRDENLSARSRNVIIDNHIVQANLKYFADNLLNDVYSASTAKSQNKPVTTDYKDIKDMVEVPPEYPGGIKAFLQFIEQEFHPPDTFASSAAEDKLLASFVVEKDGSITDIVILKDLGYGTGEELKRVLKLSKKWRPAMQNGKVVRMAFTLPVRLPLPGIIMNEPPITQFTLNESAAPSRKLKLAPLTLTKQRYLFSEKFNTCMREDYNFESGKQALSDRYSIIQQISEGISVDSLKKLTGRISFEVLIDTMGHPCILSLQNELNVPSLVTVLKDAVETKTKWNITPAKGRQNGPLSVILVFSFTDDRMYYRHMAFAKTSPALIELEGSEKGKFSKY